MKPFVMKYAEDEERFFLDYQISARKLSNVGTKWEPAEGITLFDI